MKRALLFFTLIVLICSACSNRSGESAEKEAKLADVNPENITAVEFDVQGMTCTGCENTVITGVSELDGVADVSASFLDGKVWVKFDTAQVKTEEIEAMISKKGYKVSGHTGIDVE